MNLIRSLALFCAVGAFVGCSGSKEPPRGPVKGRITIGGKPLSNATVSFESKGIAVSQTASTDADGKYEFVAYNSIGLPAGSYKVAVSSGRFMQPGEETPRFEPGKVAVTPPPKKTNAAIPDKYAKGDTSGLTAEVKAGDNPAFDFDLKP